MKTEAFVLTKFGTPNQAFQLQEKILPKLQNNEVIIEVESFGLNYADVMARNGLYRETPPLPCVLGYEVVGKVVETALPEDQHIIGKRVVGFTRFGGYAKHAITNMDAIVEIDNIPTNDALALATQGVTAYYMANYISPIRKNDHVFIHAAAGGVGTLLIQLAKLNEAIVYAKVSSEEKVNKCRSLGADFTINYTKEDYGKKTFELLQDKKMDVCYNPIGGSTFKIDKTFMGPGSRLFLFGGSQLAEGKLGILSQVNFLRKMGLMIPAFMMMQSKAVIGTNMLKIANARPEILQHCMEEIIRLYKDQKIKTENGGDFSANALNEAHLLLESGKSIGKIAIHW